MAIYKRNILIIDDDPDMRNYLNQILSSSGAFVREAESAHYGFESIKENIPDIILLDMNMPGESGLRFSARLRELELYAKIPIIILSQNKNKEIIKECKDLGIQGYLAKPVKPIHLKNKIREVLKDLKIPPSVYIFNKSKDNLDTQIMYHVHGILTQFGPKGLKVATPIKIETEAKLKIQAKIIRDLNLDQEEIIVKSSTQLGRAKEFSSICEFEGLTELQSQNIFNCLKEWP